MTTIIKIVVVLLLLTAAVQGGRAALAKYQFEDAVQQAVLFSPNATDAEVEKDVLALAYEHGLPIEAENITIRMLGADRIVETTYTADVGFIPGFFSYPMTFNTSSSVRLLVKPRR